MKNILLFCIGLLISNSIRAQQQDFYMVGVFSNNFPATQTVTSTHFLFTQYTYKFYYDSDSNAAITAGSYIVNPGQVYDTIEMMETAGSMCNHGQYPIRLRINKRADNVSDTIWIYQTAEVDTTCATYANNIYGVYTGTNQGNIVFLHGTDVNTISRAAGLNALVYDHKIEVSSLYDETVKVSVRNISGQEILPMHQFNVNAGKPVSLNYGMLPEGMYFVVLQSAHEAKVVKFVQ